MPTQLTDNATQNFAPAVPEPGDIRSQASYVEPLQRLTDFTGWIKQRAEDQLESMQSDVVRVAVQTITSGGAATYVRPSGTVLLQQVLLVGGGGGGGSGESVAVGTPNGGDGGNSGTTLERVFFGDFIPHGAAVSVGFGGNGGAFQPAHGNGNNGATGGDTTLTFTVAGDEYQLRARGGIGGRGGAAGAYVGITEAQRRLGLARRGNAGENRTGDTFSESGGMFNGPDGTASSPFVYGGGGGGGDSFSSESLTPAPAPVDSRSGSGGQGHGAGGGGSYGSDAGTPAGQPGIRGRATFVTLYIPG